MRVGITCTNASLLILMMFDYFENRSLIGGIWVNFVKLCRQGLSVPGSIDGRI